MVDIKEVLILYKNTLKDIFETDYYQYLKENYRPLAFSLVFNQEGKPDYLVLEKKDLYNQTVNGIIPNVTVFRMYPGKEVYTYALSLLRQFILTKDLISIHKICKIIRALSSEKRFEKCKKIVSDYNKYIKGPSNLKGRTIKEYMDNINYSDIYHRNIPREVRDYYANTHFAEYFLKYLTFIYNIGILVKIAEFDDQVLVNNNPEDILNRPREV